MIIRVIAQNKKGKQLKTNYLPLIIVVLLGHELMKFIDTYFNLTVFITRCYSAYFKPKLYRRNKEKVKLLSKIWGKIWGMFFYLVTL